MVDINPFLQTKNLYANEKELVFYFALFLRQHYPHFKIHFEVKYSIPHQRFFTPEGHSDRVDMDCKIDLVYLSDSDIHAVEFKYFSSPLQSKTIHGVLKDHSSTDVLRFGFRKDVYRLDQLKQSGKITSGTCILLTNSLVIMNSKVRENSLSKNYVFSDRFAPLDLGWHRPNQELATEEKFWEEFHMHNYKLNLSKEYKFLEYPFIPNGFSESEKNSLFKYYIVNI